MRNFFLYFFAGQLFLIRQIRQNRLSVKFITVHTGLGYRLLKLVRAIAVKAIVKFDPKRPPSTPSNPAE